MFCVQSVPIKNLTLLKNNPRKIDKDQFEKLKKSLTDDPKFFDCRPCLVNIDQEGIWNVYAGNQRVQAAKKLGWKEVPCIVDTELDEKTIKQRTIKDNQHYGVWDDDLVNSCYDVDMLLESGFTPEELTGDYGDVEEVESKDKEEKKPKVTICPNCSYEF